MGRNCVFQQFHLTLPEIESSRHNTKEIIHNESRNLSKPRFHGKFRYENKRFLWFQESLYPRCWKNQSTQKDIEATHIWLNYHISATYPPLKLTAKAPENRPKNGPKKGSRIVFQASIFRVLTCFSGGVPEISRPNLLPFWGWGLVIVHQHGHLFNKKMACFLNWMARDHINHCMKNACKSSLTYSCKKNCCWEFIFLVKWQHFNWMMVPTSLHWKGL